MSNEAARSAVIMRRIFYTACFKLSTLLLSLKAVSRQDFRTFDEASLVYLAHEDHKSVIRIARKYLQVGFCGHSLSRLYEIPEFAQRVQTASVVDNGG